MFATVPQLLLGVWLAVAPADVREATRSVLADEGYQTQFPGRDGATPAGQVRSSRPPRVARRADVNESVSGISQALLWVVIGVVVALFVVWLANQFRTYGTAATAGAVESAVEGKARPPPPRPIASAEALAEQGKFEEAVHALLLTALQLLKAADPLRLPDSLTSREVLRTASLENPPKRALRGLIHVVEVSLFGGQPVDQDMYRSCAADFQLLEAAVPGAA